MHPLELTHLSFVRTRTTIRHDKLVLWWMKRCWAAAPAGGTSLATTTTTTTTKVIRREQYDEFYRKLLVVMTVEWDEEVWAEISDEMWVRDAGSFHTIDFNRFCCSVFAYAEMWVDALELVEYTRVLKLIYNVASSTVRNDTTVARRSNPSTLSAFLLELQQQQIMVQENVSLGKSVLFDPQHFVQAFGAGIPLVSSPSRSISQTRRHTATKALPRIHRDLFVSRPRSSSAFVRLEESSVQREHYASMLSSPLSTLGVRPRTTTKTPTRLDRKYKCA